MYSKLLASKLCSESPSAANCEPIGNHNLFNFARNSALYFVGIGGAGMSSLAMLLKNRGYSVSGSDSESNPATEALRGVGVEINFKQNGDRISREKDLIVTSAAIPENNPDLEKARKLGIKIIKYSQLLGILMKNKKGVAVSGAHGKTTTTAMISFILKEGGLDPSYAIGGDLADGECFGAGNGDLFVTEACEYDRTFLRLYPDVAVITNIDEDHLDYYKNLNGLRESFAEFAMSVPHDGLLVINNDDENIKTALKGIDRKRETYTIEDRLGFTNKANLADWVAFSPVWSDGGNSFKVYYKGMFFGEFTLSVPGRHNVMNALAAIAVCNNAGVSYDAMSGALSRFVGVNRRFQTIGSVNDITIVDDYAHHPTEILTTLKTAKDVFPNKRIWCLFQPHQYSRTKLLLDGFSNSFGPADKVILSEIYGARDCAEDWDDISSADLLFKLKRNGIDAKLISSHAIIANYLAENLKPNDLLLIMGAGDIWKVGGSVFDRLLAKNGDAVLGRGGGEFTLEKLGI